MRCSIQPSRIGAVGASKLGRLEFQLAGCEARCENERMKSVGLTKIRAFLSVAGGGFFLVQSLNPQFLRTNLESTDIFVHVFLALFGAAFFAQAYVLGKQINGQNSR